MTCFSIGKQKYTDSTKLAEPTEAGKLKPLQSLSKWTPKRKIAMSVSPFSLVFSLFSQSKIILFLRQYWLRLTWQIFSAIFNTQNRKQWKPRTLHSLCINAMRESNKWKPFNGPISRVNLFSFTLIVRKGKVETLIMRSWTWVKKREKIHHLKRNENKKGRKFEPNRNVTETWSFVSDAETRRKRVLSMENWITMFPHGGNLTDISNFPFPSS